MGGTVEADAPQLHEEEEEGRSAGHLRFLQAIESSGFSLLRPGWPPYPTAVAEIATAAATPCSFDIPIRSAYEG